MKSKTLILAVLICLVALPLISAELPTSATDSSFIFKKGETFDLQVGMANADLSPCLLCTCDYTLFYPNGSAMVTSAAGVNVNGLCTYSTSSNILGTHGGNMYFTNGADNGRANFNFQVTMDGRIQSISQGIGSLAYLLIMIGLTFVFGYIGFRLSDSEYLWVLGLLFLVFSIFFVVYDLWLAYEYRINLTGLGEAGMAEIFFFILLIILLAGLTVAIVVVFKNWKKVKDKIKQAITEDDDKDDDDGWDHNNFEGNNSKG